jgi:anti-anti-sigma factor
VSSFSVNATFEEGESILAVRGDLPALTSPEVAVLFDAMIDRGEPSVVLDLSGLHLVDASSLAVIAQWAARLKAHSGGLLTVRSTRDMITQLRGITGLARLVQLEQLGTGEHLRRQAAIHSESEVVDVALHLAASLARATVGGADGVSVSLRRHGHLSTVAATDQTISDMDSNQYVTGEGPCIEASVVGQSLHARSLDREVRWPAFTPRARALGINAILSTPLLVQERPVGALNIYSLSPAAFSQRDQQLAGAFAAETSLLLSRAGAELTDDQLSVRFQGALRAREVIAQAQGVLMEREGVTKDEAYTALRRFSLRNSQPLQERAEHVVDSTRRPRP